MSDTMNEEQSDAAKMLENAIQKGHRWVLCIEPAEPMPPLRMQVSNVMDARQLTQMLGRFWRSAREDAKWPGDSNA